MIIISIIALWLMIFMDMFDIRQLDLKVFAFIVAFILTGISIGENNGSKKKNNR